MKKTYIIPTAEVTCTTLSDCLMASKAEVRFGGDTEHLNGDWINEEVEDNASPINEGTSTINWDDGEIDSQSNRNKVWD